MSLNFEIPTPLAYFAALVASDAHFPLLEAAVSIAQDEYPELDVQQVLGEVDRLVERLKRQMPADATPLQRLRVLNQFFFRDLGFSGNVNHYHDPDNSFLSAVLCTRRGIPISLALLWMELAQGVGLPAHGVGFPGHFMVKVQLPGGLVVIDPFTGQSLGRDALAERLEPYQLPGDMEDEFNAPLGLYLQAAHPRDIIARMLRNLKEIYRTEEDWTRMLAVQNRLIVLLPAFWNEYRDRGLLHAELGNAVQAILDLEIYLENAREAVDHRAITDRLSALQDIRSG